MYWVTLVATAVNEETTVRKNKANLLSAFGKPTFF